MSSNASNAEDYRLQFPAKMFQIIEIEDPEIVRWESCGTMFRICNYDRFEKEVAPKYFRHCRSASLRRQLNLYGFKCAPAGPMKGAFFHPKFRRGEYELARRMRREDLKNTRRKTFPLIPMQQQQPVAQTTAQTYADIKVDPCLMPQPTQDRPPATRPLGMCNCSCAHHPMPSATMPLHMTGMCSSVPAPAMHTLPGSVYQHTVYYPAQPAYSMTVSQPMYHAQTQPEIQCQPTQAVEHRQSFHAPDSMAPPGPGPDPSVGAGAGASDSHNLSDDLDYLSWILAEEHTAAVVNSIADNLMDSVPEQLKVAAPLLHPTPSRSASLPNFPSGHKFSSSVSSVFPAVDDVEDSSLWCDESLLDVHGWASLFEGEGSFLV